MRKLTIQIELNGVQEVVGEIFGRAADDAVFQYSESYLANPEHPAISISLPLQKEAFTSAKTRCFFDGLLPEGYTRHSLAQSIRTEENDYLSILETLGKECLGAIKINCDANTMEYVPVTEEELKKLAEEGTSASLDMITKAHLSLTGASGKVGLYLERNSGKWYLPIGEAPSTHIVKQSHIRLKSIVTNEQLSLMTAEYLGIDVPKSFIINTGSGNDEDVLLATQRYDRLMAADSKMIGMHHVPLRLHQEDFAQALGIANYDKYENNTNQNYMKRSFELLKEYSFDPIADEMKLWERIVFNYLIGNTDGHLKNISLLYSKDMKKIRLAPAYDIVCTSMYESCTKDMAFAIGGDLKLDMIKRSSFERASKQTGLSVSAAMRHFDRMVYEFPKALRKASSELEKLGYSGTEKMRMEIMHFGGVAYQGNHDC